MRPVIYDVAVTLDGFIAAPNGDFSMFPGEGPHLQPYLDRLMTYDTVVMGAATYRVGLDAGLAHGARAYPAGAGHTPVHPWAGCAAPSDLRAV
jgi:hypothetical protein